MVAVYLVWKISAMYFVVHHDIRDTEDFWIVAQKNLSRLPEAGVKRIVSLYPNQAMDKCTSVWEADTIESLEKYFEENIGSNSRYSYYQINEAAAFGPGL